MSKRFKGDMCVFCSERTAVTADHIFAREFFLESARANLPQAPLASNGASPYGGLVLGRDGNFYGTTESGGTNGAGTPFDRAFGGLPKRLTPGLCTQTGESPQVKR